MKTRTIAQILTELVPKKGKSKSDVARRLGISSQLLGQYMKGRHEPKLPFYEAWQREFGEDLKPENERNVSHETLLPSQEKNIDQSFEGLLIQLMKVQNRLMETQNKILEDTREMVSFKISGIEQSLHKIDNNQERLTSNLTATHDDVIALMTQQRSEHGSMMDSLDRLEGKAVGTIAKEASNVELVAAGLTKGTHKKKGVNK